MKALVVWGEMPLATLTNSEANHVWRNECDSPLWRGVGYAVVKKWKYLEHSSGVGLLSDVDRSNSSLATRLLLPRFFSIHH